MTVTPVQEGSAGVRLRGQCERRDGAGDGELVSCGEKRKAQERWRGVQRGGQRRSAHSRGAAAGLDERHLVVPADFVLDADAPVELDQIGADAKEYVLAVVDDFAGAGMLVGRSAAAEIRAAFKQGDAKARIGEGAGGGQSGEAAAGDGYGGLG